jgi:hypothetical protein
MDTPKVQVQYTCTDRRAHNCHGTGLVWVDCSDPIAFNNAIKLASPLGWHRPSGDSHVCQVCFGTADLARNGLNVGTR